MTEKQSDEKTDQRRGLIDLQYHFPISLYLLENLHLTSAAHGSSADPAIQGADTRMTLHSHGLVSQPCTRILESDTAS